MSSMITLGVSFLLFFVTLGFMWLVGVNILAQLFDSMPEATGSWAVTAVGTEQNLKAIFLWVPPILVLFASIKMLVNAASSGRD